MKTVLYKYERDEYVVNETDMPSPADHELVLQIKACALSTQTNLLGDEFSKENDGCLPVGSEVAGIVSEVGSKVTRCKQGERVAGLIPLDSSSSGCAEFCIISEYNIVRVGESVDFVMAAVAVGDGIKAHTALHYQAGVGVGDTVLVIGGAWGSGPTIIQLALLWGAKVLTTSRTMQEKAYLESLQPAPACVIDMSERTTELVSAVLEETGGLGVDVIIDCGVRLFPGQRVAADEDLFMMPSKHEVLSCLAAGGHWITSHSTLQLDPPDAQRLFLSGASLSFLFHHTWTLSSSQQGRLLHMMEATMRLVSSGDLRPQVSQEISLSQVPRVMSSLTSHTQGRVVMTAPS